MATPNINKFVINFPKGGDVEYTPADLDHPEAEAVKAAVDAIVANAFGLGKAPTNIVVHITHKDFRAIEIENPDEPFVERTVITLDAAEAEGLADHFRLIVNNVHDLAISVLAKRANAAPLPAAHMLPAGMPVGAGPNVIHIGCGCARGHGGGGGVNAAMVAQLTLINTSLDRLEGSVRELAGAVQAFVGRRGLRAEAEPLDPRRPVEPDPRLVEDLRRAQLENDRLRQHIDLAGRENELRLQQIRLDERERAAGPLRDAQAELAQAREQLRRDREEFQRALREEQAANRAALLPLTQRVQELTEAQRGQLAAIERLDRTNAQLQRDLAANTEAVRPLAGEVRELRGELDRQGRAAQLQLQAIRDANTALREQLAQTTALVRPLEGRVEELQAQLVQQGRVAQEQLEAMRAELQAQRELSTRGLTTLRHENAQLRHLVEELRAELQADRERNAGLIGRLDRIYNEQILALRDRLAEVEEAGQALEALRAGEAQDLAAARHENERLQEEIARLGRVHDAALARVQDELQAQHAEEVRRLQIDNLRGLVQARHQARQALAQQAQEIHAENQRTLQGLDRRNRALEDEIRRLQATLEETQRQIAEISRARPVLVADDLLADAYALVDPSLKQDEQ